MMSGNYVWLGSEGAYLQYTACLMTMFPSTSLHLTQCFVLSYRLRPRRSGEALPNAKSRRGDVRGMMLSLSAAGFPQDMAVSGIGVLQDTESMS